MEVEPFPIRFTRGIRSYWRRRRYQRLEAADGGGGRGRPTRKLGGGGGWGVRLRRRLRAVVVRGPARLLRRARDAYVGGMLAVAAKASAAALPDAPEGLWSKRVPRRKSQKKPLLPGAAAGHRPTEFEQRLILEIYKSIVASKELTTMLHSSTAHLHPPAPAV